MVISSPRDDMNLSLEDGEDDGIVGSVTPAGTCSGLDDDDDDDAMGTPTQSRAVVHPATCNARSTIRLGR
jgi:hypothetical protein